MIPDLGNEKRALRAELRQRRRTRTTTERDTDTAALTATLQRFAEERQVHSVALYLSASDEPNVRPFLNWAFEHGIRVLLPVTREDGLLDWAVGDGSSETEGLFGMPEVVGEVLSPGTTAAGWAGAAATTTRPSGPWRTVRPSML
jgi:5-formyltetrahydrofolate cyclo-ligase